MVMSVGWNPYYKNERLTAVRASELGLLPFRRERRHASGPIEDELQADPATLRSLPAPTLLPSAVCLSLILCASQEVHVMHEVRPL